MPARDDTIALIAIASGVAALDQLTKSFLVSAIGLRHSDRRFDLVDGWLGMEYVENRGAAFGLFAGISPILTVASLAILTVLLVHYARESRPPLRQTAATGAIVGGAAGNLIDRFRLGYVIDFVSIGPWPNFNIADSAITLGVLVLIWDWMRSDVGFREARTVDWEG